MASVDLADSYLYAALQSRAFHPACGVDGIAEQAVPRSDAANDSGHHSPGVHAHPDAHRASQRAVHRRCCEYDVFGESDHALCVLWVVGQQAGRAHPAVADSFDLVDAVKTAQAIVASEELM